MKYIHSDLGSVTRGSTVVARLSGTEANVMLLDDINFARYQQGDRHDYYGGHFRSSPATISVPTTGRWNVVVDLGGYSGHVEAAISVVAA